MKQSTLPFLNLVVSYLLSPAAWSNQDSLNDFKAASGSENFSNIYICEGFGNRVLQLAMLPKYKEDKSEEREVRRRARRSIYLRKVSPFPLLVVRVAETLR